VPVVLASRSPQRRHLLRKIVSDFEVIEPCVEECARGHEGAEELAYTLARAKAEEVARRRPDALVIAADTVVECEGELIGKPRDRADAIRVLTKLVANPHRVVTGLCVIAPDGRRHCATVAARVRMKRMPAQQIESYVDREDVMGRAGAYGLRELDPNVQSIEGSPSSVMGLPLEELTSILKSLYPPKGAP